MNIGMMPAKLTHTLINIWLYHFQTNASKTVSEKEKITIYDPFCGFWTTNLIASALWHDSIGSDINITQAKHNSKRRQQINTDTSTSSKTTLFKHDVTNTCNKPFLKYTNIVVTEWRLGPKVSKRPLSDHQKKIYEKIVELYTGLFKTLWSQPQPITVVCCIPRYEKKQNPSSTGEWAIEELSHSANQHGLKLHDFWLSYARTKTHSDEKNSHHPKKPVT